MSKTIFLAGACGAIGSKLIPLLLGAGFDVHGSTRRPDRAAALESLGVHPVIVDVYDACALSAALSRVAPGVVIHQLTDLPHGLPPARMPRALINNARVRTEGTRNLVAAAQAAGARRLIAQSIAWVYAVGPKPHTEEHPLDTTAEGARRISIDGVLALEQSVLSAPGLIGTVLRYGQFYGPGTGTDTPVGASPVHVEAAAWATLLALQHGGGGIFNIADTSPDVSSEKAHRLLDWHPSMRLPIPAGEFR